MTLTTCNLEHIGKNPVDVHATEFTILPYADYRAIFRYKPAPVPSWNGFWEYFFWAKAHGFTPYGGESKQDEQAIFELNVQQIKKEWEAQQREWRGWLDKAMES